MIKITSDLEYEACLQETSELFERDPDPSSTDGKRLLELVEAIEEYELVLWRIDQSKRY